jgi:outer membrane protein assembly factor BamB
VVVKKTTSIPFTAYSELIALNLNNGNILWNATIGDYIMETYRYAAFNTPADAEDTVFVSSPDGILYAFDVGGDKLWSKSIYNKGILSTNYLLSSPAYADGIVYIGTPEGTIYAIDADTNNTIWSQLSVDNSGIISSPIIVDGLIFFISEDGIINCRGKHQLPSGEQITGSCYTIPIQRPKGSAYKWDYFYSDFTHQNGDIIFNILDEDGGTVLLEDIEDGQNISQAKVNAHDTIRLHADFSSETNGEVNLLSWLISYTKNDTTKNVTKFYENNFTKEGTPPNCSIDIRNEDIGIWNTSAKYRLKYENETGVQTTKWILTNCSGINGSTQRETIWANISELNLSENITWYLQIRFKIKNTNGEESFSNWLQIETPEYPDQAKPRFNNSSFTPSTQWISTATPTCTILVQDNGTSGNISGLNVSSATYTLTYENESGTYISTFSASCTGQNGTTAVQIITADVSTAPDSENFTNVSSIFFSIADLAGNSNSSSNFSLNIDSVKPTSEISNVATIPSVTNSSPVLIKATAEDE